MAKIVPGTVAGQVSGSIGSTVFSHNRYGSYIRRRSVPTNPSTIYQQQTRAFLAAASAAFADLTAAQKLAWAAYAQSNPVKDALGQSVILSAGAAYAGLNSRLLYMGVAQIDDPPVIAAPVALTTLTLEGDIGAGDFEVNFTPTPTAAGEGIYLRGALVTSPGVKFVKNRLRLFHITAGAQATGIDISSLFPARFGTVSVGQTVHIEASVIDRTNGQLSQPLRSSVVITTT